MKSEDYFAILSSQDNRCAICGKHDSERGKHRFHVDHDHRFARGDRAGVRGILCHDCNTSIGKLGDNIPGLKRALAYLERFESQIARTG